MTARQVYEAMLIEMNKVEAPSMLLEDFNYLINKAIYLFINKNYNIYDVNLQTTDAIRVLKATAVLKPNIVNNPYGDEGMQGLYGGIVEFSLPLDYLHLLNCICNFKVKSTFKCYNANDLVQFAARRLTSDMWSQVINNFYMRPMYRRPYYYIHNVNTNTDLPTNPITDTTLSLSSYGTDSPITYGSQEIITYVTKYKDGSSEVENTSMTQDYELTNFTKNNPSKEVLSTVDVVKQKSSSGSNLPRTISLQGITNTSLVEKEPAVRYGNPSPVRLEIRYGKDQSVFELDKIYIDYIKTPQHIRLTQEQLDLTMDTSQIMEFPDLICQEIINELVKLMLENASDPRLQTNIPINLTIASPVPQGQ